MRRDVASVSEMSTEIQMRTGHAFWAKNRQNNDVIDIQELLKYYWGSAEHHFTVASASRPLITLPTQC